MRELRVPSRPNGHQAYAHAKGLKGELVRQPLRVSPRGYRDATSFNPERLQRERVWPTTTTTPIHLIHLPRPPTASGINGSGSGGGGTDRSGTDASGNGTTLLSGGLNCSETAYVSVLTVSRWGNTFISKQGTAGRGAVSQVPPALGPGGFQRQVVPPRTPHGRLLVINISPSVVAATAAATTSSLIPLLG